MMTAWLTDPRRGGLLILAAIIALLPLLLPNRYYYDVAIHIGIAAIAVVGLNLLIGYAGQISLGHAGFFGIGSYAVAVLPGQFGIPSWLAFFVGLAFVALLAFLVGRPILRLKGHYLAVATLGMGILIYMVLTNESQWTGGPDGMAVGRLELFGWKVKGYRTWYWITGAALLFGVWFALNLIDSPSGRALRALHDSEIAAQVAGVDIANYKLFAFVISALYACVAGAISAFYTAFVTPDVAGFLHSIELVSMVVLGGMASTFGGILGAALLTALPQVLTVFHDYEHMILGLVIMVCMIFLRRGILPSLTVRLLPASAGGRT